jgi:cytoplasmic iron level regulating protein YaaA (DUF328/UPF0246 family)
MDKVVLLSCVSMKLPHKAKACELYVSPLFKSALKYARSLNPNKIFILSAKYGLVDLNDEIESYDQTLNAMSKDAIMEWSNRVLNQLKNKTNLDEDEFIFLAGERYRKYLLPQIKNYQLPMKGLGIGKQLKFLKEKNEQRM